MSDILIYDDRSSHLLPPATQATPLLSTHENDTSQQRHYGIPTSDTPDYKDLETREFLEDANEMWDGVSRVEVLLSTWSNWGLAVAYMSILLMAFTTSLEGQVTYALTAFATSSFNNHSLLSTVYVVQSVVNAVIKPPMAKVADVFGRLEAFSISVFLCVLGYILMASSQNIETYASAQIFYSAGSTGLQILQQVFIADTSSFLNRALFSSLPDSPFLVTVWIGSTIASTILTTSSWHWGYGVWAIILPVAFLPLALCLFFNNPKAQRQGLVRGRDSSRQRTPPGPTKSATSLLHDLDIIGTLLLSGGLSLFLLPLTLVSHSSAGWSDIRIQGMVILGIILLILFPIWESRPCLAPHPLLPLVLLKSRTFVAGCLLGFFYFMIFYIAVQPYFYSYLLVALNLPVSRAGQITQTFSFASTIAALLVSLGIRQTGTPHLRLRPFILLGAGLYTLAIAILIFTRTRDATVGGLFAAQSILGAGAGLMHVVTQLIVQASCGTNKAYVGVATAAFLTLVEVGGAIGAALSGAVWGRVLPGRLRLYLPDTVKERAMEIFSSVKIARSFEWGSLEREAICQSYQDTVTVLLWIALGLCLPLLAVVWLIPRDYRFGAAEVEGGGKAMEERPVGADVLESDGDKVGEMESCDVSPLLGNSSVGRQR